MIIELNINRIPDADSVSIVVDETKKIDAKHTRTVILCLLLFGMMLIAGLLLLNAGRYLGFVALIVGFLPSLYFSLTFASDYRELGVKSPYDSFNRPATLLSMLDENHVCTLADLCKQNPEVKTYIETVNRQGRQLMLQEFRFLKQYAHKQKKEKDTLFVRNIGMDAKD